MNKDCEMCVLVKKVFGDRYDSCGEVSSEMAELAIKSIKNHMTKIIDEGIEKCSPEEKPLMKKFSIELIKMSYAKLPAIIFSDPTLFAIVDVKELLAEMSRCLAQQMTELGLDSVFEELLNEPKNPPKNPSNLN